MKRHRIKKTTIRIASRAYCRRQDLPNGFSVGPLRNGRRVRSDKEIVRRQRFKSLRLLDGDESVLDMLKEFRDNIVDCDYVVRLYDAALRPVDGHALLKNVRAKPGAVERGEIERASYDLQEFEEGTRRWQYAVREDQEEDGYKLAQQCLAALYGECGADAVKAALATVTESGELVLAKRLQRALRAVS